jgi:hypothetical protein
MPDDAKTANLLYGNPPPAAPAPTVDMPLSEMARRVYGEPSAPAVTPAPTSASNPLGFDRYAALKSRRIASTRPLVDRGLRAAASRGSS